MIKKQIILLIAIYIATLTSCTSQNNVNNSKLKVSVGKNILVGTETKGWQFTEPHVAAHPSNPNHLLAVGMIIPTAGEDFNGHLATFVSFDGGLNWKRKDFSGYRDYDPWVTLTEDKAVITTLAKHKLLPYKDDQLLVYFSSDGGETWSDIPQSLGPGHDGSRSVASKDGTIYITSGRGYYDGIKVRNGVFVARIRPKINYADKIHVLVPSNLSQVADGLTTLSDGTLVITYHDYQRPADKKKYGRYAGRLKTRRVWAMTSKDKGRTFSFPKLITESSTARPTDITADTSNVFKDRLYHVTIGDKFKTILVTHSTDGGDQWSDPIPVEPISTSDARRFAPQIAVNKDGVLAVAWMDNRENPSGNCYTPYIIFSTDGGNTFSNLTKVGSKLSCPITNKAGEYVASSKRWSVGGDYFGLTASADGKFHVVWADARSGKFDLMTSAITVKK